MQTLFSEVEEKKVTTIKIKGTGQKLLSKNQQLFNKLTARIENLEKEIVAEGQKLSKLLEVHSKEIRPLKTEEANTRLQLAMTIGKASQLMKLTQNQTEITRTAILQLCDEAFMEIEPNPEQEAFYDKWAETSYKEEMEEQKNASKEMMSNFMGQMFDIDLNEDDFDDSPEGFARLQEKLRAHHEQQQKQEQGRKKSKKLQAQEERQKAEEETKNKSIRSIYIALAKLLHPDSATEDAQKAEKEEIMKKVTVAYEQKDLPTLLRLEMEWVHKTSEHLEKLSDDKLKIYISTLKQQVAELEQEKYSLYQNPMYSNILEYARLQEKYAIHKLLQQKSEVKSVLADLNMFIATFRKPNSKKQLLQFVKEYVQDDDYDELDHIFDNMFANGRF